MLKVLLYADNPEKLETMHAYLNQVFQHMVFISKIDHEYFIKDRLRLEKPDIILLDIQNLSHHVLEFCNHPSNRKTHIWLISLDIIYQNKHEINFYRRLSHDQFVQHTSLIPENHNIHNFSVNHAKIKKIAVPTLEGYTFIESEEIIRFEAKGTYTNIFTNNGRKITSSKNIGEYEQNLLELPFFRIHQSHLINLNKIQRYLKGRGGTVIMEDGTQIEVASRRKNDFVQIFQ